MTTDKISINITNDWFQHAELVYIYIYKLWYWNNCQVKWQIAGLKLWHFHADLLCATLSWVLIKATSHTWATGHTRVLCHVQKVSEQILMSLNSVAMSTRNILMPSDMQNLRNKTLRDVLSLYNTPLPITFHLKLYRTTPKQYRIRLRFRSVCRACYYRNDVICRCCIVKKSTPPENPTAQWRFIAFILYIWAKTQLLCRVMMEIPLSSVKV